MHTDLASKSPEVRFEPPSEGWPSVLKSLENFRGRWPFKKGCPMPSLLPNGAIESQTLILPATCQPTPHANRNFHAARSGHTALLFHTSETVGIIV